MQRCLCRLYSTAEKPSWRQHREAMRRLYPGGWDPPTKVSRPTMELIRSLHEDDPSTFTTSELAKRFKISPEGVRRILRSRWKRVEDEATVRRSEVEPVVEGAGPERSMDRMGSALAREPARPGPKEVKRPVSWRRSLARREEAERKSFAPLLDKLKAGLAPGENRRVVVVIVVIVVEWWSIASSA